MDKDKIIRQLKRENELLKARIGELEAQLAKYENPHAPPSQKRGGSCGI
jgi:BMFP domain-containing protein YqiC